MVSYNLAIHLIVHYHNNILLTNQAHLRASGEKDSNLVRLEPILAQVQQSTDQETSQIKVNHVEECVICRSLKQLIEFEHCSYCGNQF